MNWTTDPPNYWTAIYRIVLVILAMLSVALGLHGDADRERIERKLETVVANGSQSH